MCRKRRDEFSAGVEVSRGDAGTLTPLAWRLNGGGCGVSFPGAMPHAVISCPAGAEGVNTRLFGSPRALLHAPSLSLFLRREDTGCPFSLG